MLVWGLGQNEQEGNPVGRDDPEQISRTVEPRGPVHTDCQNR